MANIGVEYSLRRGNESYDTIAHKFQGVRILQIDNFLAKGEPINIYTAQWLDSPTEDFLVTTTMGTPPVDTVVHKNVDLKLTFLVTDKLDGGNFDVVARHDEFVNYMTSGDFYLKSNYVNKEAHCVCLSKYEPTVVHIQRDIRRNYILGSLTLHVLSPATNV